ncbi:MAG: hypothetical protein J0G29_04515 [Alphaproteobacteria bacterium]|nr:hypothetical protein [Alphaproteobacteria bacterium]OJV47713.1 MAG: hypothetical protein BGO28_02820 [Alphaproteobacteria bacterium 43-37]
MTLIKKVAAISAATLLSLSSGNALGANTMLILPNQTCIDHFWPIQPHPTPKLPQCSAPPTWYQGIISLKDWNDVFTYPLADIVSFFIKTSGTKTTSEKPEATLESPQPSKDQLSTLGPTLGRLKAIESAWDYYSYIAIVFSTLKLAIQPEAVIDQEATALVRIYNASIINGSLNGTIAATSDYYYGRRDQLFVATHGFEHIATYLKPYLPASVQASLAPYVAASKSFHENTLFKSADALATLNVLLNGKAEQFNKLYAAPKNTTEFFGMLGQNALVQSLARTGMRAADWIPHLGYSQAKSLSFASTYTMFTTLPTVYGLSSMGLSQIFTDPATIALLAESATIGVSLWLGIPQLALAVHATGFTLYHAYNYFFGKGKSKI